MLASRHRIHITLLASPSPGHATPSPYFSLFDDDLPIPTSIVTRPPKASPHPSNPFDPRLQPLSVFALDMPSAAAAAAAASSSASSSNTQSPSGSTPSWRCQFNKSSSFTVDEGDASSEVSFGILHLFRDGSSSAPSSSTTPPTVALDDDSATVLALLGLPGQMTAADFLAWVEPAISSVEKMRMIRQGQPANRTAVLIKFRDPTDAEEFYKLYNGQPLPVTASSSSTAAQAAVAGPSTSSAPTASTSMASLSSSTSMPTLTSAQIVYVTQVTVSTSPHLPYVYPQLANSDPWPLAPTAGVPGDASSASTTSSSKEEASSATPTPTPTPAARLALSLANELPTCPVCLERMDSSITGIMTVSCQHSFHCECLSRWADGRCPVCRYSQNRAAKGQKGAAAALLSRAARRSGSPSSRRRREAQVDALGGESNEAGPAPHAGDNDEEEDDDPTPTSCASCGATDDLWVCLICAAVGCGRYKAGCAARHFAQSNHLYSLELETARVWDYVHDGYVHRLIQNRADGKLVELDAGEGGSPARRRGGRRSRAARGEQQGEQSAAAGSSRRPGESARDDGHDTDASSAYDDDDASKDDKSHAGKLGTRSSQLEAISLEYQYLLLSQLESQRSYYEEQVRTVQSQLDVALSTSSGSDEETEKRLREAEREKDQWQKELASTAARVKQLEARQSKQVADLVQAKRDLEAERLVTRGLLAKLEAAQQREERAKLEAEAAKREREELDEELRDLRFALSARDLIEGEGGGDHEAKGGDVVVTTPSATEEGAKKKSKKKKKVARKPPLPAASTASTVAAGGQEGGETQEATPTTAAAQHEEGNE